MMVNAQADAMGKSRARAAADVGARVHVGISSNRHHQSHGLGGSSRTIRAAGRIIKPRGIRYPIRSMMIPQGGGTFPLYFTVWGRGVFGWNYLILDKRGYLNRKLTSHCSRRCRMTSGKSASTKKRVVNPCKDMNTTKPSIV